MEPVLAGVVESETRAVAPVSTGVVEFVVNDAPPVATGVVELVVKAVPSVAPPKAIAAALTAELVETVPTLL